MADFECMGIGYVIVPNPGYIENAILAGTAVLVYVDGELVYAVPETE